MPADDRSEPRATRRFRGGPSTGEIKRCHTGLFHLGRFQSKAPAPASAAWCFTSLRWEEANDEKRRISAAYVDERKSPRAHHVCGMLNQNPKAGTSTSRGHCRRCCPERCAHPSG